MKEYDPDRPISRSGDRPLPPEMQAVLDRYMENLKAELRRKYPQLAPPEFRDKEPSE